jgi:hypothetical protein
VANGHGGARPGAGKKPTRELYASKVRQAEKRIADRLPDIADALLRRALGVSVQTVDKDGGVVVYTEPPDVKAAAYLLDRIMGKPVQAQEVSGPGGGPVRTENVSQDPGDDTERLARVVALLDAARARRGGGAAGGEDPG